MSVAPAVPGPEARDALHAVHPEPDMVQLLTPEGARVSHPDYPLDISDDEIRSLYRDLVLVRRIDSEAIALQRQGELGLWASLLGQEGAQVGAGRALRPQDMAFPTYREHGVAWCRNVDPLTLLGLYRGTNLGGWNPADNNFNLYTIVIGQGDVNESFVWAGADNLPIVYFCQNNQWAISAPVATQTRQPLYRRAAGFGFPGVRIDGNDVLASLAVTRKALNDARSGQGPTLIEAFTYRMNPHTTSDDSTRYRLGAELETWKLKDPIARVRAYLTRHAQVGPGFFESIDRESEALAEHVRSGCRALPDPEPLSVFDHVHTELTDELREQRDGFATYLASFEVEVAGGAA